jgi:regulation of enolase protein 1 (concanavalin A-like superfamily)
MFEFSVKNAQWFNKPKRFTIEEGRVEITTDPGTDFWQRTYYGFRNDNAHVLYNTTGERAFSFSVQARFDYSVLYDQCGIAVYQDCDNWIKAGIEYRDKNTLWLGSVVTCGGYSDWATTETSGGVHSMWYRLSRRESDFLLENSPDGLAYRQMRIFHFHKGADRINFGLLACSPGENSFNAVFTGMNMTECLWKKHGS